MLKGLLKNIMECVQELASRDEAQISDTVASAMPVRKSGSLVGGQPSSSVQIGTGTVGGSVSLGSSVGLHL